MPAPPSDGTQSWQARLELGDHNGAWAAFDRDHRKLFLSVIRRLVSDHDQVEDAFTVVAAALSADNFARLRRYSQDDPARAAFSSWLIVVVRRLVIDWLRQAHGRERRAVPSDLEGWQRAMYVARCLERLSAAETFELMRGARGHELDFPMFLRELRALARSHPCPEVRPGRRLEPLSLTADFAVTAADPAEAVDQSRRLVALLDAEPADVRLAIQLFVVEELGAAEVARVVGWPNAKAVYNRVSRSLTRMRESLAGLGIRPGDL